jgi:phage terminase small subunit
MIQRGRKSQASLSLIPLAEREPELEPPDHLSAEAREIWLEIVRSRPRQFHAVDRTLLGVYCAHCVTLRLLSDQIARLEASTDLSPLLDRLLKMRARESASLSRLASKLRLLPTKAEPPLPPSLPWADGR